MEGSSFALLANGSRKFNGAAMESCAEWILWAQDRIEAARQLSPAQQQQYLKSPLPEDPLGAITLICRALKSDLALTFTKPAAARTRK